ncbi:MAG: AMP-binding protein [Gemmatimonadota bacterium]|nr:AMP-binding protein [Gemmatimonadota bacterium]
MAELSDLGAEGVVAQNSEHYLRAVLSRLARGRPVVTLRSEDDAERRKAAGVKEVEVPMAGGGWVRDLGYEPRDHDQIAQVLFTSGTQGESKGVLLTHGALANTTERIVSVMAMDGGIREYVGVPVYHSFGFGRCRAIASVGGELYLPPDGFSPREIAHMLEADEINAISAVPTLWRLVLSQAPSLRTLGERVRWIEIGSQFMSADEKRALRDLFPRSVIVQHYGLTEASRSTFLEIHRTEGHALESVGKPTGGVEISIGEDSAIRIRGPHLASGLLRNGVIEPLVDKDSWFTTSDAGHLDDGGYLYFEGRTDDIINCAGVKLSPDLMEERIGTLLQTSERIGVSRIPDELRGDAVLVAVRRNAPGLDSASVRAAASHVLSEFGVSAAGAIRLIEVEALPTTDTGKLRRGVLRELYDAVADSTRARHGQQDAPPDAPRDEVEQYLLERVADRFAMTDPALNDSILSNGADSLASLELVMDIESQYGVELALADLYRAPTVAGIATSIRWLMSGHQPVAHRYVVPLSSGEERGLPKLFIVGGSYGNVLHLHDLALGLCSAVTPYGIQYRGLLENDEPRETLEETANDFLDEMLACQPMGPYLVGGYSGGGLIAVEIARQLLARGAKVQAVFMIDTRLPARLPYQPRFTAVERQRIRWIESRRSGEGLTNLLRRALGKVARTLTGDREPALGAGLEELSPIKQRSERIHAAFVRASEQYQVPKLPTRLCYFRPRDEDVYALPSGSIDFVDGQPHRVNGGENGWRAFFNETTVRTTPGGHYTLAHAPNARHLAEAMVEEIKALDEFVGASG